MSRPIAIFLSIAVSLVSAGCGSVIRSALRSDQPPAQIFVLEERSCNKSSESHAQYPALTAADPIISSPYGSNKIIYAEESSKRSAYLHSTWSESPGSRIVALLIQRLRCGGIFEGVYHEGSVASSTLYLASELHQFLYDLTVNPNVVRISFVLQLIDSTSGKLLAERTFYEESPVAQTGPAEAVAAFQAAVDRLTDEAARWIERVAAERAATRSRKQNP